MSQNQSSKRGRRHFTGEQKAAIVKAHLIDKVPLSDLCEKHQIQVAQFHQWQKQLFENAAATFERKNKPGAKSAEQQRIEALQAKLINKNEVIAELMEENVKAKKANGEL